MTRLVVRPVRGSGLAGDEAVAIEPGAPPAGSSLPTFIAAVSRASDRAIVEVVAGGWRFELEVEPEHRAELRERATRAASATGGGTAMEVHAMIPGRIVAVSVAAGDEVSVGTQLVVVEAMKMQNEVRSPADGAIARVAVAPGDTVELGDLLVVLADRPVTPDMP